MKRDRAWATLASVSDLAQKAQPDDELWEHIRQRLADEGIPPERAEALASAPRNGHENVRHPIRAVERAAEHLHVVADEGKSPATPAILIGGVALVAAVLTAVVIALAFGIAYFVTRGDDQSTTAPAFSANELSALPTDNWITTEGSLANQRYSPLTNIDTTNVSRLQSVWLTHLRKSGVDGKYSAEGEPLEYKGVLYVPTGTDDNDVAAYVTAKIANKK